MRKPGSERAIEWGLALVSLAVIVVGSWELWTWRLVFHTDDPTILRTVGEVVARVVVGAAGFAVLVIGMGQVAGWLRKLSPKAARWAEEQEQKRDEVQMD